MIPVRQCSSPHEVRQLAIETARRLRARYGGGVSARVEPAFVDSPPSASDQKKDELAEKRRLKIEERNRVIQMIALRAQANIDVMKAARSQAASPDRHSISVNFVRLWYVARSGVSDVDLRSARRTAAVVIARQRYMWLCRKVTLASLPQIGRDCGGRDHTTVLHAWDKLEALRETDASLRSELDALASDVEAAWQAHVAEAQALIGGGGE